MSSPGGSGPPYKVEFSPRTSGPFKDLLRTAVRLGIGKKTFAAAKSIVQRLENAPTEFGEPLYRLPALKLHVYVGIVPPLVVHYAVHDEMPLVFVKGVAPMPGHGL
jgi:hypothetical protein